MHKITIVLGCLASVMSHGSRPSTKKSLAVLLETLRVADQEASAAFNGARLASRNIQHQRRAPAAKMDETFLEGLIDLVQGGSKLKDEGTEEFWKSEKGWSKYLDEKHEQSYAMNARPSLAGENGDDAPGAGDIHLLNAGPIDNAKALAKNIGKVIKDPLDAVFPTISNDPSGTRSWGKNQNEIMSRTIKPKVKDMDPSRRKSVDGFNLFGSPAEWSDFGLKKKAPFSTDRK